MGRRRARGRDRAPHDRHQLRGRRARARDRRVSTGRACPRSTSAACASRSRRSGLDIVDDISFEIAPGRCSGSSASPGPARRPSALALLGHARPGRPDRGGSVRVGDSEMLTLLDRTQLRAARGASSSPTSRRTRRPRSTRRCGSASQLRETLEVHGLRAGAARTTRIGEVLEEVALPRDPSSCAATRTSSPAASSSGSASPWPSPAAARDRARRADDRPRRHDPGACARDGPRPLPPTTASPPSTSATTSPSWRVSPTGRGDVRRADRRARPRASSSSSRRRHPYTRRLLRRRPRPQRPPRDRRDRRAPAAPRPAAVGLRVRVRAARSPREVLQAESRRSRARGRPRRPLPQLPCRPARGHGERRARAARAGHGDGAAVDRPACRPSYGAAEILHGIDFAVWPARVRRASSASRARARRRSPAVSAASTASGPAEVAVRRRARSPTIARGAGRVEHGARSSTSSRTRTRR